MNNRRRGRRGTYRPSRANGILGMVCGCIFLLIGIFVVIPSLGAFGALWTAMAAAITGYNAYVAFGKKYIGPEIRIEDEAGGEGQSDPEERLRFKNIVSKLEGERTIIISTHIVEDVENLCDELVIINNGTVAAQGTCAEIENAAAGKVYEIEDSRLGELSEPYFIQRQFERDSKRMTAVLSAQAQPAAASVSPRVEDGYICITKNI